MKNSSNLVHILFVSLQLDQWNNKGPYQVKNYLRRQNLNVIVTENEERRWRRQQSLGKSQGFIQCANVGAFIRYNERILNYKIIIGGDWGVCGYICNTTVGGLIDATLLITCTSIPPCSKVASMKPSDCRLEEM